MSGVCYYLYGIVLNHVHDLYTAAMRYLLLLLLILIFVWNNIDFLSPMCMLV